MQAADIQCWVSSAGVTWRNLGCGVTVLLRSWSGKRSTEIIAGPIGKGTRRGCNQNSSSLQPGDLDCGTRLTRFYRGMYILWVQIYSSVQRCLWHLCLLAVLWYLSAGTPEPCSAGNYCISLTGDLRSRLIPWAPSFFLRVKSAAQMWSMETAVQGWGWNHHQA